MSLKLPEPLPYDYVDELLDSQYKFDTMVCETDGEDIIIWSAWPTGTGGRGNIARTMVYPYDTSEYDHFIPDKDGYVTYHGTEGMCWFAQELTEAEIDQILEGVL